jgi:hypothetical protein
VARLMATDAGQILSLLGPSCRDVTRRGLLENQTAVNGIDFVEFELGPPHLLHVHFVLDPTNPGVPPLPTDASRFQVHGGTRIVGFELTNPTPSGVDPKVLDIEVDQQGDFSPYLLTVDWKRDSHGRWIFASADIDRLFSVAPVNFRPGCPVDFDCEPVCDCPEDVLGEPALDYLARDYASFRQLLLDLVAQRNPTWVERSPADVGIALLELFAYEGDHISYLQDAVSNEAFLDTARQRVSAKRHAKLVDYQMHDGRNAWAFVHYRVKTAGTIPSAIQLLSRVERPMRFDRVPGLVPPKRPDTPPGTVLNVIADDDYLQDQALTQVRVFETSAPLKVDPLLNELQLHTWGNENCCLVRGATTVCLFAVDAATKKAVRPGLGKGDYLLLEEVLGPETGAAADADPAHRQVVRVADDPVNLADELFKDALDVNGQLQEATPGSQPLPLLQVSWSKADALTFPLCLSATLEDTTVVHRVSVGRGNIGLADHGRSLVEKHDKLDPKLTGAPTFRLRLKLGPQTMQCAQPGAPPTTFPPVLDRRDLTCDVRKAVPAIALEATRSNGDTQLWLPVADLFGRTEPQPHFVADVDDFGRAVLRFGDGQYGQQLIDVVKAEVWYRVGNGTAGNLGAEGLAHIVQPDPPPAGWPPPPAAGQSAFELIRNPLPAAGGVDPELIEEVRQYAPAAFRATQVRAVTEQDYKDRALTIDGVQGAVARFRWTGSWYTVFVGIDPSDPDNVITNARGVASLEPGFRQTVHDSLTRYRLAGYDLEIRAARYVPLDVAITLCVKPGYFAGDVAHAVSTVLGSGVEPKLGPGLFNPDKLTFGQPVYLSRIYEAVEKVEGVESATATVFHRYGRAAAGELESGLIPIGPWEIARLDNDPNNMENGTLTLSAAGGS